MKTAFIRFLLQVERAMHMADAYLSEYRGDMVFRADCLSRAYECERRIAILEINHA